MLSNRQESSGGTFFRWSTNAMFAPNRRVIPRTLQTPIKGDTGGWCLTGSPMYMDVDMTHIARVNGAAIEGKSEYYIMLKR